MRALRQLLLVLILSLATFGCGRQEPPRIQGYIEADYVYPAAPFGGRLLERPLVRGQAIGTGELVGMLDATEETLRVAQFAAAAENARLEAERRQTLIGQDVIARSEWDRARLFLEEQQQALAEARWRLDQKRVTAPCTGIVHDTYFEPGDWVPAGRPILAILPADRLKVRFYAPAPATARLTIGTTVHVHATSGVQSREARIAFISDRPEYTPPVIYSEDRSEKLVFLVEARLDAEDATDFHPGQPVQIEL